MAGSCQDRERGIHSGTDVHSWNCLCTKYCHVLLPLISANCHPFLSPNPANHRLTMMPPSRSSQARRDVEGQSTKIQTMLRSIPIAYLTFM